MSDDSCAKPDGREQEVVIEIALKPAKQWNERAAAPPLKRRSDHRLRLFSVILE